jgi:hypothetical protein
MKQVTDRGSRVVWWGLAFACAACGGAAFRLDDPPDAAFLEGTAELDSGASADATPDTALDASVIDASRPEDAATPPDAPDAAPDASELDTGPSCAAAPPIARACGTTLQASYPTALCVDVENDEGYTWTVATTPAACNSWCTFTCACLADAGVCAPGTTAQSCEPRSDGTINMVCVTPSGM